jgi:general secretion pathway protein G
MKPPAFEAGVFVFRSIDSGGFGGALVSPALYTCMKDYSSELIDIRIVLSPVKWWKWVVGAFVLLVLLGVGIGILLSRRVVAMVDESRVAKAMSDLASLDSVIQRFQLDTGRYPSTAEGLDVLKTSPPNLAEWRGPYVEGEIPNDPWEGHYVYELLPDGKSFRLLSYGSDGKRGGSGMAADILSE